MRLIDADKLAEKLKGLKVQIDKISINRESRCLVDVTQVIEYVENAPTVATMTSGNDLIRRADAFESVCESCELWIMHGLNANTECPYYANECAEIKALKAIPSAEAVQGWIPFTRRPMTEEEQKDYPNCTFMFDCVLPDDGDEILVSNGRFVWMDVFCNDIDGCYLDSGDDIDEDMAWMPLPEPYKYEYDGN